MGLLIQGRWCDQWYDTAASGGKFRREPARFRNWITRDGAPGPSGGGGFRAESGRYHLYVSMACPWAHRTLIVRALKGLQRHISVSVVHPHMLEHGWEFRPGDETWCDHLYDARFLYQLYTRADPGYSGRVTVPVLWDRERSTIVSNESAEIIRMFNRAFDDLPGVRSDIDLYPEPLRAEIDRLNLRIYETVNNGVYKAGFATTQEAYEQACLPLFETLDWLEERLSQRRYLAGEGVTEADWRLFTTLVRFDAVYFSHFRCSLRRLADYPALSAYVRDLYQMPGIAGTVDLEQIRQHYYVSHTTINPGGIVPLGPVPDFSLPHGRDTLVGD